jgi:hypothetical protein
MNYSIYVDLFFLFIFIYFLDLFTYFFRDEDVLNNIEEAPNIYFVLYT